MTKRQAYRIALATNASYILLGAETECIAALLSDKDNEKFLVAQREMAWRMLKQAGFDRPMNAEEVVCCVLNGK